MRAPQRSPTPQPRSASRRARIAKTLAVRAGGGDLPAGRARRCAPWQRQVQGRVRGPAAHARPRGNSGADRTSGRRRLPVRARHAAAGLSRCLAAGVRGPSIPPPVRAPPRSRSRRVRLFELVATRWVDLCTLPEPKGRNYGSPPAAKGGGLLEGSSYAPARLSNRQPRRQTKKRINVSPVPIADRAKTWQEQKKNIRSGPARERIRVRVVPPAAERGFWGRCRRRAIRLPQRTGRFRPSASSRRH